MRRTYSHRKQKVEIRETASRRQHDPGEGEGKQSVLVLYPAALPSDFAALS